VVHGAEQKYGHLINFVYFDGDGVKVGVGVKVSVGVAVTVAVSVGVYVSLGNGVSVGGGVLVTVGVEEGIGVGVVSTINPSQAERRRENAKRTIIFFTGDS